MALVEIAQTSAGNAARRCFALALYMLAMLPGMLGNVGAT